MQNSQPIPRYFVSGIGTDVGKTVVAALLTEALQADYWKPVQAGDLDFGDTDRVRALVSNPLSQFHPEAYRLQTPMSPDAAAARDNVHIDLQQVQVPATERPLIVEGAGGLLVPLNQEETIIDLIAHLGLPVILVSRHYLGSINHTLMSVEALKQRQIPLAGIIFNGAVHPETEASIAQHSGAKILGRIDQFDQVDAMLIQEQASLWKW